MRFYNDYMDEVYSTTSTFSRKVPGEYSKLKNYMETNTSAFDPYSSVPKERSTFNKIIAPLNVGQFAIAGFAKGMVNDDMNPIQGMLQGIWAINPLSEKSEWQYSFSEVLDDAGWKPETASGKVAKAVVGTGLDIFLDPLTYLSGGTMGVVKGSGKAAAKTATGTSKIVDLLGDSAKFVDNIEDLTKAGRMTQDVAEAVVKNSKIFKSGMDTIDVTEDASRLMKKFNDLIGVYDKSADVTLSLANAPLGKKIFGRHADKSLTLIDSDVVKAFGDSTIAPLYGKLRNQVFGSKIGELFSPNHTLYKLGKSDPGFVYDFMKSVDLSNGLSADKLKMADVIRKEGAKLLNLTPKQQEEVISAMENKTIQHKVKKMMRFAETEEATEYVSKIRQAKKATEDKIDELLKKYSDMESDILHKEVNIASNKQTADYIKEQRVADLLDLDERYINMTDKADDINNMIEETANSINVKKKGKDVVDKWNLQKEHYKQAKIDSEVSASAYDTLRPKQGVDIGVGQVPGEVLLDEAARSKIEKLVKPDTVPESSWRKRYKPQLTEKGYIEHSRKYDSDKLLAKLDEGWLQSTFPDGKTRLYPPGTDDIVLKPNTIIEKATPKSSRIEAIDAISEHIYGRKGFIAYDTYESKLDDIVKMIEDGADPEAMHYKISQTIGFYNGAATQKYSYVASKVGYGKDKGNWQEFYTNRLSDLLDKKIARKEWEHTIEDLTKQLEIEKAKVIKPEVPFDEQYINIKDLTVKPNQDSSRLSSTKEKLRLMKLKKNTPPEFTKLDADMLTTLHQKNLQREVVLYQFKDAHTAQEVSNVIKNIKDAELEEFVTAHFDDYVNAIRRNEFVVEDFMDEYVSGTKRQYHKADKKGEIFKLSDMEREQVYNHLNNEDVLKNYNTGKYKKSPEQLADLKQGEELLESAKTKRDALAKLMKDKNVDPLEIEGLKSAIDNDIKKGQALKTGVFEELVDQKKKPTADTIIDYYDKNPDVKKTTEQINNIKKSKDIDGKIESYREEIRNYRQMQSATEKPIIRTSVDDLDADIVGAEYLYNKQLTEKKIGKLEETIGDLVIQKQQINKQLIDSMRNFKYEPSLYDMRKYNIISSEVEKQLATIGKEFSQLSPEDLADVYKKAEWKYLESIGADTGASKKKLFDGVKKEVEKRNAAKLEKVKKAKEVVKKPINNIDDLANSSQTYGEFISKQRDLDKIIDNDKILKGLSPELLAEKQIELDKINSKYETMLSNIEKNTLDLESSVSELKEAYKNFDTKEVENLVKQIGEYEGVLNNADAFEAYVSSVPGGKDAMEETLRRYNSDVGKYMLGEDVDISNESKEAVEFLRNKFREMGQSELDIGKLNKGQVLANEFDYLPHMLTDDGKKLFANKDFQKKMVGFGDEAGFGREFNQFAKSRKFKTIPDGHGGWISNPTIVELNNFFRDMAGGKDIFSTDVSELYINRALKHNDLMYDNKYMENMLTIFGDVYNGEVNEGYTVAMNYGKLKQTTQTVARGHQSLDISDVISEYMSDKEVRGRIARETERRIQESGLGVDAWKKINNEVAVEYIQAFMEKNVTDEVRTAMYEGRLGAFVQETRTGKMLDELAVPLARLDDEQISAMNSSVTTLKKRYEKHIVGRFNKFATQFAEEGYISTEDLSIDGIEASLKDAFKIADEIDADRISRMLNRIDEFKKIEDPQIGQINSAIFEKANLARELQITRDQNKFLGIYDKITHFIKVNQTAILPGFHARNMSSNKFQSALGVGVDALDPELTIDAYKAMMFAEGKDGFVDKVITFAGKNGDDVSMKMSELYQAAKDYGAIDEGFFAKDLGTASGEGLLSKFGIKGKFDPTNMNDFVPYVKGTEIGSTIENHDRFIHFISRVKSGDNYHQAAESVNKFLFDYSDLTAFEQNVMKRIFPYYTWVRKNIPLQLEQMLEQPNVYRNVSKILGGIEGMVNEEDKIDKRFLNDFAKDWIQTPFYTTNEDGRKEPVLLKPDLPFMDVGDIPNPFKPKETAQNLITQMNPMLKLPIEFGLNKNMFFDTQIAKRYDKDYYKPNENMAVKYTEHALNQFGIVPLAKGIVNKTGADFGFHLLNNTSGIKMMSYDYDKYKAMQISRYNTKKQNTKSNPGIIDSINRRLGGK